MSDQQFIHYHKPTRIFEFFFGQGLEKILKNFKEYNYLDIDNLDIFNKFICSNKICKRSIDEPIFPNKLYKELLNEIKKTKYEDWSHSVHGVSKGKKKKIEKIKKLKCHICNMYPSDHKTRHCPKKQICLPCVKRSSLTMDETISNN